MRRLCRTFMNQRPCEDSETLVSPKRGEANLPASVGAAAQKLSEAEALALK